MNLALHIAYDGSCYLGWQETSSGPSIEGVLKVCLEKILNHPVQLQAASRTDAGVHAKHQVVNFFTNKNLDIDALSLSLKRLLPADIHLLTIESMPDHFHPTLDCQKKIYSYTLQTSPLSPFDRHYIWHYPYTIDLALLRSAAGQLIGKWDFKAFETTSSSPAKNTVREIYAIDITETAPNRYEIQIQGDHFLYKMVRTIVGTLVQSASQKLLTDIPTILKSKDRKLAGITAPAHALFLLKTIYN